MSNETEKPVEMLELSDDDIRYLAFMDSTSKDQAKLRPDPIACSGVDRTQVTYQNYQHAKTFEWQYNLTTLLKRL